jgi:hypothetical protein
MVESVIRCKKATKERAMFDVHLLTEKDLDAAIEVLKAAYNNPLRTNEI